MGGQADTCYIITKATLDTLGVNNNSLCNMMMLFGV